MRTLAPVFDRRLPSALARPIRTARASMLVLLLLLKSYGPDPSETPDTKLRGIVGESHVRLACGAAVRL